MSHQAPDFTFAGIPPGRPGGCGHLLGQRWRQRGSSHETGEKAGREWAKVGEGGADPRPGRAGYFTSPDDYQCHQPVQ